VAAKEIEKDPQAAFKKFQDQSDRRWNGRSFGLFVVDTDSGKILAYPDVAKSPSGYSLDVSEINGKPFAKSSLIKTLTSSSKNYIRNIHIEHDPDNLGYGDFYILTLPVGGDADYILCAAEQNWQMERLMVRDMLNEVVAMVDQSGPNSFKDLKNQDDYFNFKQTEIFVMDTHGNMLFDPAFPSEVNSKYSDKVLGFLDKLTAAALENPKGEWIFGQWPSGERVDERPRWYFVRAATHGGTKYIVGCGIHALDDKAAQKASQ